MQPLLAERYHIRQLQTELHSVECSECSESECSDWPRADILHQRVLYSCVLIPVTLFCVDTELTGNVVTSHTDKSP